MIEKKIHIEQIFESDINSIRQVEPIIYMVNRDFKMGDTMLFNILIAATEAVNNAIVHGNKFDPDKKVNFEISACSTQIEIWVKDQGEGFNPENVADPREPDNLLKSNGRGVFIIKELANDCVITSNPDGTTIYMKFILSN